MITTAPVTMAAKVEKATAQAVVKIIEETIVLSEEALAAIESGMEKKELLKLLKNLNNRLKVSKVTSLTDCAKQQMQD